MGLLHMFPVVKILKKNIGGGAPYTERCLAVYDGDGMAILGVEAPHATY